MPCIWSSTVSQTWSSGPLPRPFSEGGMIMRAIWTRLAPGIAALALALASGAANADDCNVSDFVTGGGFIVFTSGEHGNFGVAGGCKNGSFFGHLEYVDHGSGLAPITP